MKECSEGHKASPSKFFLLHIGDKAFPFFLFLFHFPFLFYLKVYDNIKSTSGIPRMRSNKWFKHSSRFGCSEQLQMAAGCLRQWACQGPAACQGCINVVLRMASAIDEELLMVEDGIILPCCGPRHATFAFLWQEWPFFERPSCLMIGAEYSIFAYRLVNNCKLGLCGCVCTDVYVPVFFRQAENSVGS